MNSRRYLSHVTKSFRTQGVMKLLRARIITLRRGLVEISVPIRSSLSQQDGFVHAGVVATLLDSAGGYAVLSLLLEGSRVLTVEFKINFTSPAVGEVVRAKGMVRKLGTRLGVCELEARTKSEGNWKLCAWGSQTFYCIRGVKANHVSDAETRGLEKLQMS